MIRKSYIIPKITIFDWSNKKDVVKIELQRGKNKFNNPLVCKIHVYFGSSKESFFEFKSRYCDILKNNKDISSHDHAFLNGMKNSFGIGFFRYTNVLKIMEIEKRYNVNFKIPKSWDEILETK